MPTILPNADHAPRRAVRVRHAWRRWAGCGALAAACAAPAAAQELPASIGDGPAAAAASDAAAANEPVVDLAADQAGGESVKLEIVKTFSKRLRLPEGRRVASAGGWDENVLVVQQDDERTLRLHASTPGVTQLTVFDEAGGRYDVEVLIAADARALQASIRKLFPDTAVEVHGLTDTSVVLRGWITRPEQVEQILGVAAQYFPAENILNQMRVAAPQQVQLNVRIMEVQRSKAEELGFNLSWFGDDGFFSSTVGEIVPLATLGASGGTTNTGIPLGGTPNLTFPVPSLQNPTLSLGVVSADSVFNAFISALREERLLKVAAEPVQVCANGRPAYFQAGGEFPVPIPQGLGTVAIEFRKYGVELTAVPIMLGGGRVRLELAAAVSDLDFSRGTTVSGTTVPGLTQRQTNTQVELGFGETLMIAGLIQNTHQAATQKVPLLGELPGVGALFRRVKYEEAETELVILVTPHPVGGLAPHQIDPCGPGQNTAPPTTRELFGLGVLEVPGGHPCGPDCGAIGGGAGCGCGTGAGFDAGPDAPAGYGIEANAGGFPAPLAPSAPIEYGPAGSSPPAFDSHGAFQSVPGTIEAPPTGFAPGETYPSDAYAPGSFLPGEVPAAPRPTVPYPGAGDPYRGEGVPGELLPSDGGTNDMQPVPVRPAPAPPTVNPAGFTRPVAGTPVVAPVGYAVPAGPHVPAYQPPTYRTPTYRGPAYPAPRVSAPAPVPTVRR